MEIDEIETTGICEVELDDGTIVTCEESWCDYFETHIDPHATGDMWYVIPGCTIEDDKDCPARDWAFNNES